jgi:hypothetical protein
MKWIKKIYEFTLLYQIILFFIFILENYASLDEIPIHIVILSFDTTITLNLYLVLGILAVIYGALILLGINFVGSGLSDSSLNTAGKFIRLFVIYAILIISTSYYLQFLVEISIIIQIFIFAIYLLEGINEIGASSDTS